MDARKLYETNKEFKLYVDRYAEHYKGIDGISVEEALTHKLVQNVAEFYYSGENNVTPSPNGEGM